MALYPLLKGVTHPSHPHPIIMISITNCSIFRQININYLYVAYEYAVKFPESSAHTLSFVALSCVFIELWLYFTA